MTRLAGLPGLLFALLFALLWAPAFAADAPADAQATSGQALPALTGRVVDDAHVLTPEVQASLTAKLADLEAKTSRQLVVVTLPTLGGDDIEDYGNKLLRQWHIGQKGINNGAVFIVVPSEHKLRIEVGYGMEGVLTDALSSLILRREVIPRLRAGDMSGGIVAGTDALIEQMSLDPSTAEAKLAAASQEQATVPRHHGNALAGLIPLILIFFVFSSVFGRRGGGGMGWVLPLMFLGGGRGWGGGGGGGDWGGGGGFSGGGGDGGGGGASGSW